MSNLSQSPIADKVMQQLKHGDVNMRPRLYFTLLTIATIGATLLAAVAMAYATSIVFFWYRIQTADTMAWGARANLGELMSTFPWWALGLALVLLAVSVWLVRKQGVMYRHKLRTIVGVIVGVALLLGVTFTFFGIGNLHGQGRQLDGSSQQRGPGWQQNHR